jgi:4-hydroxyproline epimerase
MSLRETPLCASDATTQSFAAVRAIDSHTEGEPTRVIVAGGPDLGGGSLAERRERFRRDHDAFRRAVTLEPRGSDALVGALLVEPNDASCDAGVIYFNNVGYLGMCGHATIGVVATLATMGRIGVGPGKLETPVGVVGFDYLGDGRVRFSNVPCRRFRKDVSVTLGDGRTVHGDVAWGGNWFYVVHQHGETLTYDRLETLLATTRAIRRALGQQGVTGEAGAEIDHIELAEPDPTGPPGAGGADKRNFVLCPGGEYDRSPCGTGTSAALACLADDGKIRPGETFRQRGIVGGIFEGSVEPDGAGGWIPTITGSAFVTAETTLHFDPLDPFRTGIRA